MFLSLFKENSRCRSQMATRGQSSPLAEIRPCVLLPGALSGGGGGGITSPQPQPLNTPPPRCPIRFKRTEEWTSYLLLKLSRKSHKQGEKGLYRGEKPHTLYRVGTGLPMSVRQWGWAEGGAMGYFLQCPDFQNLAFILKIKGEGGKKSNLRFFKKGNISSLLHQQK